MQNNGLQSASLGRTRLRHGAFTLVEMMIAMAILVLLIAGIMSTFLGTLKSSRAIADAIDVNSRSRFVQERLLYDLRAITEVKEMTSEMSTGDVAKIFADYTGSEVGNCFRAFTAVVNEYNETGTVEVTYSIVDDGTAADGTKIRALERKIGTQRQKVLSNLQDGCFTFYARKKSTGTLESLTNAKLAQANAVRFAFLPQGRGPLIPGKNDPSCSAVVQMRLPSYK